MATLLLRFAGPLQSWGSSSKFDVRGTDDLPTKSGVIGMVASALGRSREDNVSDLCRLQFGVRVDCGGTVIKDFQVAAMPPYQSNISRRYYLSDAIFLVGLSSDDMDFLKQLETALTHPAYPLFLGRRSCPPTLPLVLGIRDKSLEEALRDEPWQVPAWRQKKTRGPVHLRIVMDSDAPGAAMKKDLPLSFSMKRREYTYRTLEEKPAETVARISAEHDPMAEL